MAVEESDDRGARRRILESETQVSRSLNKKVLACRKAFQHFLGIALRGDAVQGAADDQDRKGRSNRDPEFFRQRVHPPRPANPLLGKIRDVAQERRSCFPR